MHSFEPQLTPFDEVWAPPMGVGAETNVRGIHPTPGMGEYRKTCPMLPWVVTGDQNGQQAPRDHIYITVCAVVREDCCLCDTP
jgi:hypothetical protein